MCYNLFCNPLYDSNDAMDDMKNVYCCVLDNEDKDEDVKCCSFVRSNKKKFGSSIFGYTGEKKKYSKSEYKEILAKRFIKRILIIQAIVFAIFGGLFLIAPRDIAYSILISDDYAVQSGYTKSQLEMMEDNEIEEELENLDKEKKDQSIIMDAWESIISRVTSEDPKEAKKQKLLAAKKLKQATRTEAEKIAISQTPQLMVTLPTRLYGSACVGVAWISYKMLNYDLKSLLSASDGMIMWYLSGLLGLILSAVDKASGLESNTTMFLTIAYYITMSVLWNNGKSNLRLVKSENEKNELSAKNKNLENEITLTIDNDVQNKFNNIDINEYTENYNNKNNSNNNNNK